MNLSILPPKKENFEAAIAYVERLRGSGKSDFEAIESIKSVVDVGQILFLVVTCIICIANPAETIPGTFGFCIPSLLLSGYCSAYSNRLNELIKVYDTGLSFRRSLRKTEPKFQDLGESENSTE